MSGFNFPRGRGSLGFDPANMPPPGAADFAHLSIEDIRDKFIPISDGEIQGIIDALELAKAEAKSQRERIAMVIKVIADATALGIRFLV